MAVKKSKDSCKCVSEIVNSYGASPDSLISMLQDIQSKYHYLPETALRQVAKSLKLPLVQVFGVATFFKAFSLKPRGKNHIHVCLGTACHVRNAPSVLGEMERQLGVKAGETTDDMQFTLESVNCVGTCAMGPIVMVNGKYYGQMNTGKVKKTLAEYKKSPRQRKNEKVKVANRA